MKPLFASLLLALVAGCARWPVTQTTSPRKAKLQFMLMPLSLGETNVQVQVFQNGSPSPTFLNVHDDENTSVAAGQKIIRESGGRLVEFRHTGARLIRFSLEGERFVIDPNRIFSEAGIEATLKLHGPYTEAAHRAVRQFANTYLDRFGLDQEPAIVALHNNSDGDLTIHSYEPGARHAATSIEVYVAANRSPDDFFYVTDRRFFDYLKKREFNVTLQDNARVPDDGSLSVYFARKGIPYLNIEAEMSHLEQQTEMVRITRQMLDAFHLVRR